MPRTLRVNRDLLNMSGSVNLLDEQVGDDLIIDPPYERSTVQDEALEVMRTDRWIIGDCCHVDISKQLAGGSLDLCDPIVVFKTGKTSHRSILPSGRFSDGVAPDGRSSCRGL
jgi:hypothetical protein